MNTKVNMLVAIGLTTMILVALMVIPVSASTSCTFTTIDTTMYLDGDCTTDGTIYISDGFTLDGQDYTITAIDPSSGHFVGAVVQNAGSTAYVTHLNVTASGLLNVCDGGANRLRGIMFEAASGSITNSTVIGINQGYNGCQEGNAIEIRNAPFDGTHPNTVQVGVTNNRIDDYQKTGVVANGDVDVAVNNNYIGSADLDDYIAANSVQFGYGGMGSANNNTILGNDWDGISDYVGTAVLLYAAGDVNIKKNQIEGIGTDVGVFASYSGTVNIMNNSIHREPESECEKDDYGFGVWFYGNAGKSKLVHNTFSGWLTPYNGADLDKVNTVLP